MKLHIDHHSILVLMACFSIFFLGCSSHPSPPESQKYTEKYRPRFHFSPDSMWTNDPNGMVFYDGEYHLFYQHYPHDIVWGPMHWGHAVSADLVRWIHLPVALYPDSLGYIFSGSAVVDVQNTSRLGSRDNPPMIAVFTHHNDSLRKTGTDQFQYQSIAFSLDHGRTWTKYEGNPVLKNPGIRDFRDPKVLWFEAGRRWIMVLAAHDRVMFYSSPDLLNWSLESSFGENTGAHGGVWECPDLFQLGAENVEKWVLLVSVNPGGPNGGSATQYFTGEFDGHRFFNDNPTAEPLWIDYGKDNYAGVTWSGIPGQDGRRIFLGWMSNWQYANQVPTTRWRNAMTLPRELKLAMHQDGLRLHSIPVKELLQLRMDSLQVIRGMLSGTKLICSAPETIVDQVEIDLKIRMQLPGKSTLTSRFGLMLSNNLGQKLIAELDLENGQVFVDRTAAGPADFSQHFQGVHTAPLPLPDSGEFSLHVFIDRSSIEIFVNDGWTVMTELVFPGERFSRLSMYAEEADVEILSGAVYSLGSIW